MSEATRLKASWDANADAWTASVREGCIASRALATDAALLRAIHDLAPHAVLDVGCGEGWLVRDLTASGIQAHGLDGAAALVEAARIAGGSFGHVTYEEIENGLRDDVIGGPYDVIACNFALLGARLAPLLVALKRYTQPHGHLVIQTLHPFSADGAYVAGWREETFDAFGGAYPAPMPWYFRTMADWFEVVQASGWRLAAVREPLHPHTKRPLSLLLIARTA